METSDDPPDRFSDYCLIKEHQSIPRAVCDELARSISLNGIVDYAHHPLYPTKTLYFKQATSRGVVCLGFTPGKDENTGRLSIAVMTLDPRKVGYHQELEKRLFELMP